MEYAGSYKILCTHMALGVTKVTASTWQVPRVLWAESQDMTCVFVCLVAGLHQDRCRCVIVLRRRKTPHNVLFPQWGQQSAFSPLLNTHWDPADSWPASRNTREEFPGFCLWDYLINTQQAVVVKGMWNCHGFTGLWAKLQPEPWMQFSQHLMWCNGSFDLSVTNHISATGPLRVKAKKSPTA